MYEERETKVLNGARSELVGYSSFIKEWPKSQASDRFSVKDVESNPFGKCH